MNFYILLNVKSTFKHLRNIKGILMAVDYICMNVYRLLEDCDYLETIRGMYTLYESVYVKDIFNIFR